MLYAAIFVPREDGRRYAVVFPDFPGCVAQNDGMDKAIQSAREALGLHIDGMREEGLDIPEKSDMEAARKECAETPGAFLVMIEPEEEKEEKEDPVRLSISIRPSALKEIDKAAEDIGITRSGFFAVAAKHYIRSMNA